MQRTISPALPALVLGDQPLQRVVVLADQGDAAAGVCGDSAFSTSAMGVRGQGTEGRLQAVSAVTNRTSRRTS